MMAIRTAVFSTAIVCLVIAAGTVGGAARLRESVGSCKTFVRDFYNWYAAHYDQPEGWLAVIVKERNADFSPELLAALRDYAHAGNEKGSVPPELALDFDPILNAQDNDDRYVAGEVVHGGDVYRVEVLGITQGRKRVQVIADLKFEDGRWMFVNFEYGPGRGDLLSLRKRLRESR